MRVILAAWSDLIGGACRASYRLHAALRASNIDSTLLVRRKQSHDAHVEAIPRRMRTFAGAQLGRLQRQADPAYRSFNAIPSAWARAFDARQPDVVNLHWIGADTLSIADVGRIHQPTVFTLHDMWAFRGAEHYGEHAQERWLTGYRPENRPPEDRGFDLDRWTWKRKRRHWNQPRHVICPSVWLASCVRKSALMARWPVTVIPYALDLDLFKVYERDAARRILDLPQDSRIILFGADAQWQDPRKGFDLFAASLSHLGAETSWLAVTFGQIEPPRPTASLTVRAMGHVTDDQRMALLYNAADVVIVPSRQDNLPQVGTEAQACGTPVVAFDTAGLPDVVEHGVTGFLATPFSPESLAAGIEWVLDPVRHAALRENARKRAVERWAPAIIASAYKDVYQYAIEEHRRRSAS